MTTITLAGTYSVVKGDTLFLIGQKFGVSAQEIQAANGLKGTEIYPGQKLYIPTSNLYTVQKGDTLYLIAQKYGITYQELMKHNGLTSPNIEPGQVLSIPSSNSAKRHVVKPGETLFLIGKQYGVSAQQLQQHNNLSSTNIYPGQTLLIPNNTNPARPTAALASRGALNVSREDLTLLARAVYSEARGEPYEGQVAVAGVVLNRLRHPDFPNTIRGVIFQPLAFTAVADGQFWLNPNQTAYKAAQDALNGWDPSRGALYYWNPATATSRWIWSRTITLRIGKHVFGI